MSETVVPIPHPLVRAVDDVAIALDGAAGSDPMFLTTSEKQHLLINLEREIARLESLRAQTLAAADDVAEQHGARSAGAWLAHATRQDGPAGRRAQRLADGLARRWPQLAESYAAGAVSTAQVQVIGKALDDLPADVAADVRDRAESHLVEQAAHFPPRDLRVLGRRVLDVVAPEVAEAHEARLLEKEEQAADERMSFTWRRVGGGLSRAIVTLPDAAMDRWLTQLHAFASPRREGHAAPDERIPHPRRLAQACSAMLERIPARWLPQHGVGNTMVVVTIDHVDLERRLATAGLTTGTPITAGEARRLACNAAILPAVLDGASQPLDLGRARRLFSSAQRKAMAIRDETCRAEGCDIPAAWTEAHHLTPWSKGGPTDLADGVLLCSFHHHRAHDHRYDMRRLPNGDRRFHRRT